MNLIERLLSRERGFANERTYDFALRRLCVAKEDSWRGILPSNDGPDYNPEPPLFSAKFANCDGYRHMLAIANEDGKIALQDTTKRNYETVEKALSGEQCHFNAVFDLEWAPDKMTLVSASGDHTARLWEVTNTEIRGLNSYVGHTRSVKTAAFRHNDSAVFATGGRDGAILIWDTRAQHNVDLQPRADNCIYSGHAGGPGTPMSQRKHRSRTPKVTPNATSSSITGLAFQDSNTLISCGAGDGVIKVWDLRRNYSAYKKEPHPRHSLPYAGSSTFKGFTNLIIDKAGSRLYANCMDNTIYCYNLHSYSPKPLARFKGLQNSTFYIKSCLSPDGKYLLSGSSDEKAYIWNLQYPDEPLVSLSGHTVEVTCVAWGTTHDCPIVTCSDDARHKIWRIGPDQVSDAERAQEYCGHADYVRCFERKPQGSTHKYNLRELESTPRSLKRLMDQNERTPSSVEKLPNKRSFLDMRGVAANCIEESNIEPQQKRPKTLEPRGRRLFGPSTSQSGPTEICLRNTNLHLPAIPEDHANSSSLQDIIQTSTHLHNGNSISQNKYNQENALATPLPSTCSSLKITNATTPSPLSENLTNVYTSPPTTSSNAVLCAVTSSHQQHNIVSTAIYSPTSNLPNYVFDGDAPHLGIMSPKRKVKDKVDWLTKIRKQKLMSNCRAATLCEKMQEERPELASPRLQSLRSSECSPRLQATPRRRISHTDNHSHPRTPTSSRRNSETTLLRFFSIQRSSSVETPMAGHSVDMQDMQPMPSSPESATASTPSTQHQHITNTATSCGSNAR